MTSDPQNEAVAPEQAEAVNEPRLWIDKGWTARVIKNEDDDGWAVEMILDGEPEPALVGPWTMGRDKKNPKPLDAFAFSTLVKTASEVLRRHEQHAHAMLHKTLSVDTDDGRIDVTLDIVPDEDDPYALLGAQDANGDELAKVRVGPEFRFNLASARAWIEDEFRRPGD
ncbi:MAG: hypothetical protein IPO35_16540 [Uliginosibacterium sp.]|jgi:hypothetical protein|nr:hypothetical protein [Uliginosibacterium sp.]